MVLDCERIVLATKVLAFSSAPCYFLLSWRVWGLGRTFCSEEFARDVQGFTSDDDNLLAIEQLFGDRACKTTEQVTLAVNDHLPYC